MKKILFVTNDAWFFTSHRLPIAKAVVASGDQAIVAALADDTVEQISAAGATFEHWKMSPRGKSIVGELRALFSLARIIRRHKPDVVHLITIKPVLYGGILCRLLRVPACVFAVSGLGTVFLNQNTSGKVLRSFIKPIYRFAIGHNNATLIFQNKDDKELLLRQLGTPHLSTRIIRGSGVDLSLFTSSEEPAGTPVVTLAARLLRDKGIIEFIDAANTIKKMGVNARFQIAGGNVASGNPAAFSKSELEKLHANENVLMLGHVSDIPTLFKNSHIVVLPSYREGLPKVLVEAGAASRPVVTTDVPGCRDAVSANESAFLVPVRDAEALAEMILELLNNPDTRVSMGRAGRNLVAAEMTIDKIVSQHLEIYTQLSA